MYIIGLFLTFLICIVTGQKFNYCLADDDKPYLNFGTKSAYNFMHGHLKPDRNCKPIQLFVVSRHGTRYPGSKVIPKLKILSSLRDKIVTNHLEKRLGHLCDKDVTNFINWKLDDNVREDMADFLSPQGETDLKELAVRLKASFPELFTLNDYSDISKYMFRSTKTERARESMLAFIEGLFGNKSGITPIEPPKKDMLLRPDKHCSVWINETESVNTREEYGKFEQSREVQNLLVNVGRRLGFQEIITLGEMNSMYEMCRFEKAWNINATSPWCAAFSKRELTILEYREDLDYYYWSGPGRDINAKLGCPLMKDLFQNFQKLEGDNYLQERKGTFYFAHSTTLQTLLLALGFINDSQPLLASNFNELSDRQWRTSFIGPFATNLVAVFYKCNDTVPSNKMVNKVLFHWAERLVKYEGCDEALCNWEYIRDSLGKKAEECNMDFCFNESEH